MHRLQEPLLEEKPFAWNKSARAGQGRTPPIAWIEFTDANGRGMAVLTGFLLGLSCSLCVLLFFLLPSAMPFAVYFFLLVCFHMLEYLLTAAFRPDTLSFDNFLINHSFLYQLMVTVAWAEYWLEWWLLGSTQWGTTKQWGPLNTVGLLVCIVGLSTRTIGMATASTNFSHKIEDVKRQAHTLV